MASLYKKERLTVITIAYWFLLVYITAALVWWFIALMHQNQQMTEFKLQQLDQSGRDYPSKSAPILKEHQRKTAQYISEGITFMLVILVGAVFVYRATRKQILLTHQQQNFMMAVTHELKTPISVTKLNLETLQKHKLDENQQKRLIYNTLQETERLNDLCNNILLVAQLEGGGYTLSNEPVNLTKLVKARIQEFQTRFPGRQLNYDLAENVFMNGDDVLLKMAVNNIIENALKYSPREKPISISLEESTEGITIKVADYGPGVAEKEKKKIFEKFYRSGDESTRKAQGTGLGLYLTKKIVQDHWGTVGVNDNSPTGSIFVLSFQGRQKS